MKTKSHGIGPASFLFFAPTAGISRRSFIKFCTLSAFSLGLGVEVISGLSLPLKPSRGFLSYGCRI
ncbi:twin-arginine translocation signal domain-containing protein [Candidatus Methylacidiphilum infernorum]|uniref:Twin-arginine translocation signal domain-containing protein n=1 Tax=Candidatus Methylacidiphilum infernorum TaxID=511746 RepID=A0ABX7PYA1_9BACT|nr:twin-arginine translocation signal domain-containing protein [Candidatus Methylacidiphilum infernorum]